jgi:TolB-like protein
VLTALVALLAIALLVIGPTRVQRALGRVGLAVPGIAEPDRKSIAVLPFENMSGEADDTFFADGIQDDLIASLAKIEELKVISRTSSATYRDPAKRDMQEIGRELGVAAVLEGRVRRTAERVLVNVSLIDTSDGRQLWADRYDRTLAIR